MYLEGDKWKNWHTRCSDAAIKENKDEEDTKLSTISVSKLLEYAQTFGIQGFFRSGFV